MHVFLNVFFRSFWQSQNLITRKSHEGNFNNPHVSNVLPLLPRELLPPKLIFRVSEVIFKHMRPLWGRLELIVLFSKHM